MKDIIITDELKKLMITIAEQTEKDGKIRGFRLCKNTSGEIVPSNVFIGNEFKLGTEEMKCPENTTEIGIYHSNPTPQSKFHKKSWYEELDN